MPLDYVLRRLLVFCIIIWAAATLNFFLPKLSDQDPIKEKISQQALRGGYIQVGMEEMMKVYQSKFGLDRPLWQQYLSYINDLAHFDFNYSISFYPKTVLEIIRESIPWTLGLLTLTTILSFTFGTLAGALMAWPKAPNWTRYLLSPFLALSAVPYYLLGLILVYFLAFQAKWFPLFGAYTPGMRASLTWPFIGDVISHATLPALSIILSAVGFWALGMRSMMVTVQGEDYMILAEAKGLKDRTRFMRYAMRNAMLPQVTSLALSVAYIVSGAVLVEVVFNYPGIGGTLYQAIRNMDIFVIEGVVFLVILGIAITTLAVDLALPLLDPRITYGRE